MKRSALSVLVVLVLWLGQVPALSAQPQDSPDDTFLYYAVQKRVPAYRYPRAPNPDFHLAFRQTVHVIERDGLWRKVRTEDGQEGYVLGDAISNIWIRISKRKKAVFVYRGVELIDRIPADFGNNVVSDKVRRGGQHSPDDWRTPEGSFFVVAKNPNSQYYKALVLNYPTAEDARRGLRQGLISQREYKTIVDAEANFAMPPMTTLLGGWIEIHGSGTGGATNWTQGCIAIENERLDRIWNLVHVGTPVLTEY